MFSLENVSKSFGQTQVLKPTTVEFPVGKSTVLIGPSGCGKSTILRILVGLLQPDSGIVRFDGETMSGQTLLPMRRKMGYVIQEGGLFPHLTAFENITLMANHLGWDRPTCQARVEELSDLTRLPASALNRYPAQMSGGQRQRVGIMRALMLDPPVLLFDEPMGALDPMVRFELQEDLLKIIRTLSKTSIMVTHDMGEAGFFGDQVLMLAEGEIIQHGTLEDLIHHPANDYVTRFIRAQRIPQV